MAQAWHEGLPEDAFKSEEDRVYELAFAAIRKALAQALDFDRACEAIEVKDETLRRSIIDDMLKVLIAEEHFAKNIPLDELAKKLSVPLARLETARKEMFEDIEKSTVNAYYNNIEKGTEH
ncbi:MAG: hypothetical protein HZA17_02830 [Nitrospirae bacterium]|nr:hypothetical protein [Nitrospirota bacterium]